MIEIQNILYFYILFYFNDLNIVFYKILLNRKIELKKNLNL